VALRADDIDLSRDRALVEAWQSGDQRAFDDLYLLYFDRLRAYCQRRVGDRSDAEEIAQEAFTKALQALPRFSGDRRFYPWMTVIAGRLCVDHHRRRARVQPSDDVDPGSIDDGHDERYALRADLAALEGALTRLGPRHREVLDLRERDGLSYHQIAEALDVPHSTVETLLFRARRALRKEFARVSGERLAGLPVVGWLLHRLGRARSRAAESCAELATIGAPIAAGAITALLAFPSAGAGPAVAPLVVDTSARPPAPAPLVAVAPPVAVPSPAPVRSAPPPAPAAPDAEPPPAALPGITPMSDEAASSEAREMPVHVELADLGAGLDAHPVVTRLTPPGRETP
jgi:RNA polymerase sigma-70 factor (ECF subfamily)